MLAVGEIRETDDPAFFLAGEHGTFRVVSPSGAVARYERLAGRSLTIVYLGRAESRTNYLIEKIGDDIEDRHLSTSPTTSIQGVERTEHNR